MKVEFDFSEFLKVREVIKDLFEYGVFLDTFDGVCGIKNILTDEIVMEGKIK